jgi:hypothetical protein
LLDNISAERFFSNLLTEGDRIIGCSPTEAVHPLIHEGGEDVSWVIVFE